MEGNFGHFMTKVFFSGFKRSVTVGNLEETPDPSSGGDLYVLSSRGFSGIQVTLNYFLIASDRRGLSLSARSGDRKRPVLQVKAVRRWRVGRGGGGREGEGGGCKADGWGNFPDR